MKNNKDVINGIFSYDKKIDPHVFTRADKSREKEYAKKISTVVGYEFFIHVIEKIPTYIIHSLTSETTIRLEAECFGSGITSVRLVYYVPNEMRLLTSVSIHANETGLTWDKIRKSVQAYNDSLSLLRRSIYNYLKCKSLRLKSTEIEYDEYIWDTYIESDKPKVYDSVLDHDIIKDVKNNIDIHTCIGMTDDEIFYKITSQTYSEKYILSYVWVWFLSIYAEVKPEVVRDLTGYNVFRPNTSTTYKIQPVTITTKDGKQSTIGVSGHTLDVYDKDIFMRNLWSLTEKSMGVNVNNVHIGKNIDPEGIEDGICIQYSTIGYTACELNKIFIAKRINRCDELPIMNMVIEGSTHLDTVLIEHYADRIMESECSSSHKTMMNWPQLRLMFFNMMQLTSKPSNIRIDFKYVDISSKMIIELDMEFGDDDIRIADTYAEIERKRKYREEIKYDSLRGSWHALNHTIGITAHLLNISRSIVTSSEDPSKYSITLSQFKDTSSEMTLFEFLVKGCDLRVDQHDLNTELNHIINKTYSTRNNKRKK